MVRRTLRVFAVAALLSLLAVPGWGQSDAGYDAYKRGDYAAAHRIWKSRADGGDASAQYNLGLLYHHGLGVKRQLSEAAKWYGRAAENGDADAQKAIGDLYVQGFWGKKDYAKAATWYRKAAEQGHAEANKALRKLGAKGKRRPRQAAPSRAPTEYKKGQAAPSQENIQVGFAAYRRGDYATAFQVLKPLAEKGDALAQYRLGSMYVQGRGVPRDVIRAGMWFRKAAEQGHAFAQYELGDSYAHGRGVPQDYAEAEKWYRMAAEQGLHFAQATLGFMYHYGVGVEEDSTDAIKWYRMAAMRRNVNAQYHLGLLYQTRHHYTSARRWYGEAATRGHPWAQLKLGVLYENGWGGRVDLVRAYVLYSLAAQKILDRSGRDQAIENRDFVAKNMRSDQVASAKRWARRKRHNWRAWADIPYKLPKDLKPIKELPDFGKRPPGIPDFRKCWSPPHSGLVRC